MYASTSWACIFLAGITTSASSVQPGGSLTINGLSFGSNPVALHLDSLTGMVLATVTPDGQGNFSQAVTVPQDVGSGQHVVVATEEAATPDGSNSGSAQGVPARAAFQVGAGPAPAVATPAGTVQVARSVGVGTLALIGVAVACVGVFLGGVISLVASRSRRPEAVALK
ncbi:MAG TPA: hypothetical protein VHU17_18475 [Acidimicrobiales bacterium]|nr:hypothetical protein [Acidimicrobiales bacterium]